MNANWVAAKGICSRIFHSGVRVIGWMGESFPEPLMRSEAHAFTTAGGPTTVKVPALSTPHEVHSIVHDTSLASANDARCTRGFPNFGDWSSLLSIGKLLEEDPESAVLIFNTFRFFVEAPAPIAGELLL